MTVATSRYSWVFTWRFGHEWAHIGGEIKCERGGVTDKRATLAPKPVVPYLGALSENIDSLQS